VNTNNASTLLLKNIPYWFAAYYRLEQKLKRYAP